MNLVLYYGVYRIASIVVCGQLLVSNAMITQYFKIY